MRHNFVAALSAVLETMKERDLPDPIGVSWSPYYGIPRVQVSHEDFRPWVEALSDPEVEAEEYEGETHVHADGFLRLSHRSIRLPVRVHLVAVADNEAEVAQ